MSNKFLKLLIFAFVFLFPLHIAMAEVAINTLSSDLVEIGDTIIIRGLDFGSKDRAHLYFNNALVAGDDLLGWSSTTIQAKVPEGTEAGRVFIRKLEERQGYGDEWVSTYGPFFYLKPRLTSSGMIFGNTGDTLRLTGENFTNRSGKIIFNYYKEGIINSWKDTSIEVEIPEDVKAGQTIIQLYNQNDNDYNLEIDGPYLQLQRDITNDPFSYKQWYLEAINASDAWAAASSAGSGVVVAVIDSGVKRTHEDLAGRFWENSGEVAGNRLDDDNNGYVDDVYGWNFVRGSNDTEPINEHGTLVAGIIAANSNNEIGIAGIAPQAKIMPLAVFEDVGSTEHPRISVPAVIEAIRYAADNGADIINLSLGGVDFDPTYTNDYDEAIRYAYNKGVIIVAAAGNGDLVSDDGDDLDFVRKSPVCNDNVSNMVIGVAALDIMNKKTSWSDYGKDCIDISAPGYNIFSTVPAGMAIKFPNNVSSPETRGYTSASGTSFSAPIVSGVLALLKSQRPTLTNTEAKNILKSSAASLVAENEAYLAARLGGGKIDAAKMISSTYGQGDTSVPSMVNRCEINSTIKNQPYVTWYATDNNGVKGFWSHFSQNRDDNPALKGSFSTVNKFTAPPITKEGRYYFLGMAEDAAENKSTVLACVYDYGNVSLPEEESGPVEYDMELAKRLSGKILLQVEGSGEAWYIYPKTLKRYYLGRPQNAFDIMRFLGWGITDANLARLPRAGYNDKGDAALVNRLKGYIMLQVEQNGEAWYVDPDDGLRYYLARPKDAFDIMRNLSLGISNSNLVKIPPQ